MEGNDQTLQRKTGEFSVYNFKVTRISINSVRVLTGEGVYALNVSYKRIITGKFLAYREIFGIQRYRVSSSFNFSVRRSFYNAFISFFHCQFIFK
jgi:hypothetical protein